MMVVVAVGVVVVVVVGVMRLRFAVTGVDDRRMWVPQGARSESRYQSWTPPPRRAMRSFAVFDGSSASRI